MPAGLRGYNMAEAHYRRGYATVCLPLLEDENREVRQFGVAVPRGGVEHVGLRARMLHETSN